MARSIKVQTTVTIDDVDYEVSATVDLGTPSRPWAYGGEGDPGDPGEIVDVVVTLSETGADVDLDSFVESDREFITEQLTYAAEEELIDRQADADDRRADEGRDRRLGL